MSAISAQVSLYPLRQVDISPPINRVIDIFREHGLEVSPGPISTIITGDEEIFFNALHLSYRTAAEDSEVVMLTIISNACKNIEFQERPISLKAIGFIENSINNVVPFEELHSIQSKIVLKPQYIEGLTGLKPGQQIMVIFHFHRSRGFDLLQYPRGDQSRSKRGVFCLRSPNRPNPIGVSVVDFIEINKNILRVQGLDAINGTPVLDIKPA